LYNYVQSSSVKRMEVDHYTVYTKRANNIYCSVN